MIHAYKMNDFNIVLDVNSSAIHVFDDISFSYIKDIRTIEEYENIKKDIPKDIKKEIEQLIADNTLFSEDIYNDFAKELQNKEIVVKAMCLHVAHDCNLKCKYCFAEEGEYHGKRSIMSFDVAKSAIDFLIQNSGNRRNLEVDFFGGEPLLNFDVVKQTVEYARIEEKKYDKNFRFTITTNGVLLNDEMINYINEHMSNVVLSIDGRKEINDRMRPKAGGQGSYDEILPKFLKVAKSRNQNNYYVRGTFTKYNKDFAKDVMHLADLGFKQISVEPVVSETPKHYTFTEDDIKDLLTEYENLALQMLESKKEKPFNFFHFMIDLTGGPCVSKRLSGCGCGLEYLAVTPEGDIYPCHQFVGLTEYKMGNVNSSIIRQDIVDEFQGINVYTKEDCRNCFSKFYCSGGCIANAYKFHNNLNMVDKISCELQKKRVECAIMMKVYEAVELDKSF